MIEYDQYLPLKQLISLIIMLNIKIKKKKRMILVDVNCDQWYVTKQARKSFEWSEF